MIQLKLNKVAILTIFMLCSINLFCISYASQTNHTKYIQLQIRPGVSSESLKLISKIAVPINHVVTEGDSLYTIQKKYYGVANNTIESLIVDENNIENANNIEAGSNIKVPPGPLWETNYKTIVPAGSSISEEFSLLGSTFGKKMRSKFFRIEANKSINDVNSVRPGTPITVPLASFFTSYKIKKEFVENISSFINRLNSDPSISAIDLFPSRLVPHYNATLLSISANTTAPKLKNSFDDVFNDTELFKIADANLRNVIIAVIDSGVELDSLNIPLWTNSGEFDPNDGVDNEGNLIKDDIHGANFAPLTPDSSIEDNSKSFKDIKLRYHGTQITGIISGRLLSQNWINLINRRFKLMILRVTSSDAEIKPHAPIRAIDYIRHKKADIVNMSLTCDADPSLRDRFQETPDSLFVVAAGNGEQNIGIDINHRDVYPAKFSKDVKNILAVAAFDTSTMDLARFSNYGTEFVEIAAPGVNVISTGGDGQFISSSGTSEACPIVSRAAALLSGLGIRSASKIKRRLISSSDYVPALEGKIRFGSYLNIRKAIHFSDDIIILKDGSFITCTITYPSKLQISDEQIPTPWTKVGKIVFNYKGSASDIDMILVADSEDNLRRTSENLLFESVEYFSKGTKYEIKANEISEIIPRTATY